EFRTIKAEIFGEKLQPKPKVTQQGQMDLFASPQQPAKVLDAETQALVDKQIQEINEIFGVSTAIIPTENQSVEISSTIPVPEKNTIETTLHQYHLIDSEPLIRLLVEHLEKQERFCFDTETDNIDPVEAKVIGMSFCVFEKEAYYVPVPEDAAEAQQTIDFFKSVLENPAIEKIGQNLKFDLLVLKKYQIQVQGKMFDTMLANYLVAPNSRHNMDDMADNYLNYKPVSITSLIGKKGKNQLNMRQIEVERVKEYAAEDADITLQLRNVLFPKVNEKQMEKLFYEVEMPLMPVLAALENNGIKIDIDNLRESSVLLETDIEDLEERIYELAGETFNIASPKQLGNILFDKLNLDSKGKKTATGQHATGEDVLSKLAGKHEIVGKILDFRELQKLKTTYIDALPLLISPTDGRVHTSFNQAVTTTGRLSSTNPNLQNIPIRTERGREIRKAFVPKNKDFLILSADYSQIELRLMAHFSQDPTMQQAFKDGLDIHASTASKVFKVDISEVNADLRRKAKTINFGIIYGISAHGLAERLAITRTEGSEIIKAYFEQFPRVKKYMDESIDKAREQGYAETYLGRKHWLPDINSANATVKGYAERNAINTPLQGTAAEIIKLAMIKIHAWMQEQQLQSQMILQVHDELVFDAHREEIELLKPNISALMKDALPLSVPMEVGLGIGENWLEAH
ncbi:MAG: DNA polymerase I, partial [Verrucomicrobia bacterium]|nr:DNA polymerase I [Cytophagales bacterium]